MFVMKYSYSSSRLAIFYNLSIGKWTSHMHACQSAIVRSFPIRNSCNVMHETTQYIIICSKVFYTKNVQLSHLDRKPGTANITPCMYYMTVNKNSTKHTHLLDKTNFKGMLPGLKTTKLRIIALNVCMHEFIMI